MFNYQREGVTAASATKDRGGRFGLGGWFKMGFVVLVAGCTSSNPLPAGDVPDTVPDFASASFRNPTQIDNPYLSFPVGATWTYAVETGEGAERIVVEVLDKTRVVNGVACRVVRDRVFLDDVLLEDTHDWFAQDDDGNVWYMGEEVDNYTYDRQGNLIDVTHEGAWEAGKDVAGTGEIALPGYVMPADPSPGDVYNQEYYPGEAEDRGEVVALGVEITLSDGTTYACLQTLDTNPLDGGAGEFKYYAEGVGLVAEEPADGGERVELVEATP
ncbi:MAG: hypothetical protein FLDDKLPJ_01990 [Phycisphaerae bacterium]|nr:hypothetical protein [Phycisphaerae bacterium]